MAFSVSRDSVAQRQEGFRHRVPGVPGFPTVRGHTGPLKGDFSSWLRAGLLTIPSNLTFSEASA